MASQKPIKYGLMGNYPTKLKAESERKRLKGLGVRYTRVKKAQYGGYDVLVGVKPIGPNGAVFQDEPVRSPGGTVARGVVAGVDREGRTG